MEIRKLKRLSSEQLQKKKKSNIRKVVFSFLITILVFIIIIYDKRSLKELRTLVLILINVGNLISLYSNYKEYNQIKGELSIR